MRFRGAGSFLQSWHGKSFPLWERLGCRSWAGPRLACRRSRVEHLMGPGWQDRLRTPANQWREAHHRGPLFLLRLCGPCWVHKALQKQLLCTVRAKPRAGVGLPGGCELDLGFASTFVFQSLESCFLPLLSPPPAFSTRPAIISDQGSCLELPQWKNLERKLQLERGLAREKERLTVRDVGSELQVSRWRTLSAGCFRKASSTGCNPH